MLIDEKYKLSNGVEIPKIGLGTWFIEDDEVETVIKRAVKIGYRLFDTASVYGNEAGVGQGIKNCGIPRDKLFVTTKLAAGIKTYEGAKRAIDEQLNRLGLDYIDLYIIHAPQPWLFFRSGMKFKNGNAEVWRAMEEAYEAGKLRVIGVSNFRIDELKSLMRTAKIKPMVNQILNHVGNSEQELIDYCKENNILVESYSPLGHGKAVKDKTVLEIAQKYNVSPSQICLKFCLEQGTVVLPKARSEKHLKENIDLDFELKKDDFEKLSKVKFKGYGLSSWLPVFWTGNKAK